MYGADGDLSDQEILDQIIRHIHAQTDYRHHDDGAIPVHVVAGMLKSMWE